MLSDYLEKTNEPYAIAKIAGLKMCENYNNQYKLNYKNINLTYIQIVESRKLCSKTYILANFT